MLHSKVTSKGQTTIPGKIRKALGIKPGDNLEYVVEEDRATISRPFGHAITQGCGRQQEGQRDVLRPNPRGRSEGWPRSMRVPGEQTKACRHQSDRSLSSARP